jgi:hypothetical protein
LPSASTIVTTDLVSRNDAPRLRSGTIGFMPDICRPVVLTSAVVVPLAARGLLAATGDVPKGGGGAGSTTASAEDGWLEAEPSGTACASDSMEIQVR